MKRETVWVSGMVAVLILGAGVVAGCGKKTGSPGVGEKTGAALDRAAVKTVEVTTNVAGRTAEAAKTTVEVTKDVAGRVVEKTGEVMEKAGSAVEGAGADMQK